MTAVVISITRFVDEHQPGFVECELVDAAGQKHVFIEKVPVVSVEDLCASSKYPQLGLINCIVERRWQEGSIELIQISTQKPFEIESTTGEAAFVVLASQVQA